VAITIERPETEKELTDFVLFQDRVNESRPVRWPAIVPMQLPMLLGQGAFAEDRVVHPLIAREDGDTVARVAAAVDQRYLRRWDEPLGHLIMFEALPGTREATRMLMDEACSWLREEGMLAARCGFGLGEFPFVIDEYEVLPPNLVRQNPPYYHCLLKDAGFESEKGWVDYKIEVDPELVERWEGSVKAAEAAGFDLVLLRDVPEGRRVHDWVETWNDAFYDHWGQSPFTEAEIAGLFEFLGPMGMFDLSILCYRDDEPVGVLWVNPEMADMAVRAPGREIADAERVNMLAIGVRAPARGRGVNLAMASHAYLELARRGYTHLSYTLVLDDNWPSRRTAEKLGAHVCANYMVYRRNFVRR